MRRKGSACSLLRLTAPLVVEICPRSRLPGGTVVRHWATLEELAGVAWSLQKEDPLEVSAMKGVKIVWECDMARIG